MDYEPKNLTSAKCALLRGRAGSPAATRAPRPAGNGPAAATAWWPVLRLAARWMLRMSPVVLAGTVPPSFLHAGPPPPGTGPAGSAGDKRGYTLLNPVPGGLLRELTTDRPDVTESPVTVDAGHFQLELSFVEYGRDRNRGVKTDDLSVLPFNLEVGLLNHVDLQLVFSPYNHVRTETSTRAGAASTVERRDGVGNFQTRLKINFWGNDGPSPVFGETSFGFMPFLQFPTAANGIGSGHVEGGLIFPFGITLPAKFDLGVMAEFDFVRDEANRGYGTDFVHSATLGHKLVGALTGYVEYVGVTSWSTGGG